LIKTPFIIIIQNSYTKRPGFEARQTIGCFLALAGNEYQQSEGIAHAFSDIGSSPDSGLHGIDHCLNDEWMQPYRAGH